MKYQMLFWTLIAISLGFDLFGEHQSQAKPAPIFQPIIEEIRTRIPSNFQMRLPAFIPDDFEDLTLSAFIPDDELDVISIEFGNHDVFSVIVSSTDDCAEEDNPLDCTVGIISVSETNSESKLQIEDLPQDIADITPVELNEYAQGFYFIQDEDYQFVVWKQDELAYLFITRKCNDECVSKHQLIDMAQSAADEPPITRADSSFYSIVDWIVLKLGEQVKTAICCQPCSTPPHTDSAQYSLRLLPKKLNYPLPCLLNKT